MSAMEGAAEFFEELEYDLYVNSFILGRFFINLDRKKEGKPPFRAPLF